jgi:hypothetical protein
VGFQAQAGSVEYFRYPWLCHYTAFLMQWEIPYHSISFRGLLPQAALDKKELIYGKIWAVVRQSTIILISANSLSLRNEVALTPGSSMNSRSLHA